MHSLLVVALVLLFGQLSSASAQQFTACTGQFNFRLENPGPWPVIAKVRSGETCVAGRRWWANIGNTVFKRLYLAASPREGSVRLEEGAKFYYTSKKGFVGSDKFTLKLCGTVSDKPSCTFLEVRVEVTPS